MHHLYPRTCGHSKFLYRLLLDDDDYLKFTVQLDHQASQAEAAHTAATTTTSAKKEAKAVVQENRAMLAKLGVPTFAQYVARVVWWEAAGVQEKVECMLVPVCVCYTVVAHTA